jgi:hypothetical protein
MATEALTGVSPRLYPRDGQGVQVGAATVAYLDTIQPGAACGSAEAYRGLVVHEVPLSLASGTVQSTSAALIALVAGAAILLVEDPGQQQVSAQMFTSEYESVGSVGSLLARTSEPRYSTKVAEVEESPAIRGVLAMAFEKRVLSTKQVRLDQIRRRPAPRFTVVGGREPDEDE